MSDYEVETLSRKDILTAYPLVRLTMPQIDLRRWRSYATAATSRRRNSSSGILVARSRNQHYICGMLTYRALPDLLHGRRLEIAHMAALDILQPRQVIAELLEALGPLAKSLHCERIVVLDSAILQEALSAALPEHAWIVEKGVAFLKKSSAKNFC